MQAFLLSKQVWQYLPFKNKQKCNLFWWGEGEGKEKTIILRMR